MKKGYVLTAAVMIIFLPTAFGFTSGSDDWWIDTIPTGNDVVSSCHQNLVLDSQGNVHMFYLDINNNIIYLCWYGRSLTKEVVYSAKDAETVCSMAMPPWSDRPCVTFNTTHGVLKFAYWDGQLWQIETPDPTVWGGHYSSLIFDDQGNAHVSYIAAGSGDLLYAIRDTAGAWTIITLDTNIGPWGGRTCITLDSNGYPVIAYHGSYLYVGNEILKVVKWDGFAWVWYPDVGPDMIQPCIVLDANDMPHLCFHYQNDQSMQYAYWDGSQWIIETIDGQGDPSVGNIPTLRIGPDGRLHVTYYDLDNHDLKYAVRDMDTWWVETVDSEGDVGAKNAMALDPDWHHGRPHVVYLDLTNNSIKYTYKLKSVPLPQIHVNGVKGSLTVPYNSTPIAVTINLLSGDYDEWDHDMWVWFETKSTNVWWNPVIGWMPSTIPIFAYSGPIFSFTGYPILTIPTPPKGTYKFHFAVDEPNLTYEGTYLGCFTLTIY